MDDESEDLSEAEMRYGMSDAAGYLCLLGLIESTGTCLVDLRMYYPQAYHSKDTITKISTRLLA